MQDPACLAEALLAQSQACHWIVDGNQLFLQVFGDPSAVFGKSASELLGHTAVQTLGRDAGGAWSGRFARVLAGETLMLRELRGATVWLIALFPIRLEGEIRYAGGMARETSAWGKAEQELRNTVLSALKAQEFERNMVSKFLHDSVGQNLTALGLQLDLIRMDLENVAPVTCSQILEIQKLLEGMMEEVRNYSYELNPSTVERAGLRSALDRMAPRIRERFTGTLRLNVDPSLKIDKKLATAMYQIAQEAVENAIQHSGCSSIEITVKSSRTGTFIEVRDNGKGFDPADVVGGRRGLGLLSMEHYAAQAGLELLISSNHEAGTSVRATSQEIN